MAYIKKPTPPQGNGPQEAWLRGLLNWASQFELTSIVGGIKKANPHGGYSLVIPEAGEGGTESTTSAVVADYRIKSFFGDYMVCRTWINNTEGSDDVLVAKPWTLRNSLTSAVINGVTVNYVYDSSTLLRSASASGYSTVVHGITPQYTVNTIIPVADCATGVVGPASVAITKLDISNRAWSRALA